MRAESMSLTSKPSGRAWAITPAVREDRFASAARTTGAGIALVDLEDSVAPQDKQAARARAHRFFDQPEASCILGLRMNCPLTLDGVRDLAMIAVYAHKPQVVLVPKVESARDVEYVANVLDTDGYAPQIWALIETPRAFGRLPAIMRAPRLSGVVFGAADYAAAVGCGLGWEPLLWARSALVGNAAAVGIPAIDAPFWDLNDLDGLRREAEQAEELGFYGKGAVHPRQAPIIHEVFAPTPQEIEQARAVLVAGRDSGRGITTIEGQMVGTPFFTAAERLLRDAGLGETS
jgi:citrate lyase beta subunit